jgi:hypothetical protein
VVLLSLIMLQKQNFENWWIQKMYFFFKSTN